MPVTDNLRALRSWLRSLRADLEAHRRHREWLRRGVALDPRAIVRLQADSRLEIGQGTTVGPYAILDLLGDPLADSGADAGDGNRLVIGRRVAVNEFCNLRAGGGGIAIGDGSLVAQYVSIIAANHAIDPGSCVRDQPWEAGRRGVSVGEDVWIGTHAVLLPGVTVGDGCVIAAGAVVNRDLAAGTIAAGVPVRVVGRRGAGGS